MNSYFTIVKNGAILASKESSEYVDLTCADIIQKFKLENSFLFFKTLEQIYPLQDNDKPIKDHPEIIGPKYKQCDWKIDYRPNKITFNTFTKKLLINYIGFID